MVIWVSRPENVATSRGQRSEGNQFPSTSQTANSLGDQRHNARQPLLSIVIPWHGEMRLLNHAAHECSRLSAYDIEIIIVDDATRGGFPGLPDTRLQHLVRTVVSLPMNSGPGTARNAGLDAASGLYVSFLDADDEADLREFHTLAKIAQSTSAAIGVMPYRTYEHHTRTTIEFPLLQPPNSIAELLQPYPAVWRFTFRRDWLVESGARFEALRYAEDLLFLLDVDSLNPTCVSTPNFGYTHTMSLESAGLSGRRIGANELTTTLTELQKRYRRMPPGDSRSIAAEWMWRIWLRNILKCSWREVPRTMATAPRALPSTEGVGRIKQRVRARLTRIFNQY